MYSYNAKCLWASTADINAPVICRTSATASSLVNAALDAALQTGARAYSTAKDVFHTLQAQGQVGLLCFWLAV